MGAIHIPPAPLCILFSAKDLGKAMEDNASTQVPASRMGGLDEFPGSWLLPGPVLAVQVIWGLNQQKMSP